MSIPRPFIDQLLARIDIVDLINTQVPLRKKSGNNYFARCPFHNEKSASFSVSQQKQFYYCFGCGAHGNAIDFIMQQDHLSFPEAVEELAKQIGMEVPQSSTPIKKDDSLPELYQLMTQAATYYYEQMKQSPRAIQYLKNRGITGVIAQQFMLGYAPTGWSHLLDTLGQSEADKKKLFDCGMIIKKNEGSGYYDRFRDRIMFPIHDYRGRIIGFGGRILDQGEPKYLNSPETPLFQKGHELYGLHQALKANRHLERVMIVEGYMDVIALFQHGISYAMATLGTATSSHHLQRLLRYTTEIVFCFDGDEAGRTAAWRALEVTLKSMQDNMQVRFLFLPNGEDPDSLVRKEGKPAFEKRISSALSLSDFFFQTLSHQTDMNTMEGRARFATLALNYIKQLPAGLFQTMMIDALSKRARIDIQDLKLQIKGQPAAKPATSKPLPAPETNITGAVRKALTLLIQQPTLAQQLKEPIPAGELHGQDFLIALTQTLNEHPHLTHTGLLIEHWRGQKEEELLVKLAQEEHPIPETGLLNEFIGTIRQLTTLNLGEQINRLLAKAAQNDLSEQEKSLLSDLIGRKKALYAD